MRSIAFPLLVALAVLCHHVALAADEGARQIAQTFYDGYMKVLKTNGDTRRYVAKSEHLTPAFKKAYTAFMKEPDHDPIIQGQDYPDAGFEASKATLDNGLATVTMGSRDAAFAHSFKVTVVKHKEGWLISAIGDLKGK